MAVRFGVFVPQGWRMDLVEIPNPIEKYEAMTRAARAADAEEGWDSIWVFDHFHTVPRPELETTFECWTITATLARDTRRVKVGQLVTCNGYRNPALVAALCSCAASGFGSAATESPRPIVKRRFASSASARAT